MVTAAVLLLLLLSWVRTVDLRTLGAIDIGKFNSVIDSAKLKFSSPEYFYLDDHSPGDYFDSIATATKLMMRAANESGSDVMHGIVSAFTKFFKETSSIIDDQAAPFGTRRCRLLPKQFRNCRIEPRISDTMRVFEKSFRCETFDIDPVLEMATALTAEQCEKGISVNDSLEQDMQRRMMQYAKENGFDGGSENNCLPLFIARYTQSSRAVRIFKTAVDKYLLAVTTLHAFCTTLNPTQSEDVNRAKAVEIQRTFATSLGRVNLNDSVAWACDDVDAEVANLDAAQVTEMIGKAKRKVSSDDYFFNDSSPTEYFDSIKTAASYLAVALEATTTSQVVEKRKEIKEAFTSFFRELSSATDEQAAPFGINDCRLLPAELSGITIVPLLSKSLNAMQAKLGDYDGIVEACEAMNVDENVEEEDDGEASDIDDVLKSLSVLTGQGCEGGAALKDTTEGNMQESMMRYAEEHHFEGGSENNCLHLFVARYTNSEEAVRLLKKAFDKYFLATVTVQAVCSVFVPKCNEEAYRANAIDIHASFATSLARTSFVQLNDTTARTCDDGQQEIITKMSASCNRVKSTATSNKYFLGEMTAEEFENMTFGMANAISRLHAEVVSLMNHAKTNAVFPVYNTLLWIVKHRLNEPRVLFNDDDYLSCRGLIPDPADGLNEINKVAPRCQNASVDWDSFPVKWRKNMFEYATIHGFNGCKDNKCLQVFVARYTNHSHNAIEKLQHSMDKYVFLSTFLKSLCNSLETREAIRHRLRNTTILAVQSLKDGMDLIKDLTSQPGTAKPCASNETVFIPVEKVKPYAEEVIDAKTESFKARSWEDRQHLHEAIAKGIVERLKNFTNIEKHSFEALAYLPYADDERHGFIKLPSNADVVRNKYKSVNYVVARRTTATFGGNISSQWAMIEKNANNILEASFSTKAANLTSRMEELGKQFGLLLVEGGFKALAALRCGYEFVWYELGYRYFPAGYATGNHTLFTQGGNKYSDKCGQIIFFP